MSRAHPQERAFRWLIGGLLGAIFVSILISGFYPATSRQIWVFVIDVFRASAHWVINTVPFLAVIFIIVAFIAFGLLLSLAGWVRGLVS